MVPFTLVGSVLMLDHGGSCKVGNNALYLYSSNSTTDTDFASVTRRNYVKDEILVVFQNNVNAQSDMKVPGSLMLDGDQLQFLEERGPRRIQKIKLRPGFGVKDAVEELGSNEKVIAVQPNFIYSSQADPPDDINFNLQWGLYNDGMGDGSGYSSGPSGYIELHAGMDMNLLSAWSIRTDCSGVIVAVVDGGVDYSHQDLASNMWDGSHCVDENGYPLGGCNHGYDFVDGDRDPMDLTGHGTHVAGIIGAVGNNNTGLTGVCQQVQIMAVRVLGKDGFGTAYDIARGISFAIQNGAKVINLSLGGKGGFNGDFLYLSILHARDAGALVVAAAGNESRDNDIDGEYPADYDLENIISVASVQSDGALSSFSNYGTDCVHIAAPGSNIYSTWMWPNNTPIDSASRSLSGTSMATPMVAGLGALVKAEAPSCGYADIRSAILAGANRTWPGVQGKIQDDRTANARSALNEIKTQHCAR